MDKKELIRAIDSFKPDADLKDKIYNNILNSQKQNECIVYRKNTKSIKTPILISTACIITVCIAIQTFIKAGFFTHDNIGDPLNEIVTVTDDQSSIETDNNIVVQNPDQTDSVSVRITDNYCDGYHMCINYEVQTTDDELSLCNNLQGKFRIEVNGIQQDSALEYNEIFNINGSTPGRFSGTLQVSSKEPDIFRDGNEINLTLYDFFGKNESVRNYNEQNVKYEKLVCHKEALTASADFLITGSDKDYKDIYTVNETNTAFTLEKIIVSPFCTQIYINSPDLQDDTTEFRVEVSDNTGKNLGSKNAKVSDGLLFDTPSKEAQQLSILISYKSDDTLEIWKQTGEFFTSIEKGYDISQEPVESNIIYNPPISDVQQKISDTILSNTDYVMPGQSSDTVKENCTVAINNSSITDNIECTDNSYLVYWERRGDKILARTFAEGYCGLSIDVSVHNNGELSEQFCPDFELQNLLGETSTFPYQISDYNIYPEIRRYDQVPSSRISEDNTYFTIEPGEDLNFKVTFVVSDDDLKLPVMCSYGTGDDIYRVRVY